jgi:hypothetical protein
MEVIFGTGLSTGKFAMGSNEPLGNPSDFADSSLHADAIKVDDVSRLFGDAPKTQEVPAAAASGSVAGNKRKRCTLSEEDIVVMTRMTDAVNNVADAIRERKVQEVLPGLYEAVMFMQGFSDQALLAAYGHLLSDKALGVAFVMINDSHRLLWMTTYLAKNNYI